MVDELGPGADQGVTRADERQVRLGRLTPVPQRSEQLRVQPRQAGEVLCVELAILFSLAVDEPELPGVCHQDLVAQTLEETADPRGVGTGLDGYLHPVTSREVPLERLGARAHLALSSIISPL